DASTPHPLLPHRLLLPRHAAAALPSSLPRRCPPSLPLLLSTPSVLPPRRLLPCLAASPVSAPPPTPPPSLHSPPAPPPPASVTAKDEGHRARVVVPGGARRNSGRPSHTPAAPRRLPPPTTNPKTSAAAVVQHPRVGRPACMPWAPPARARPTIPSALLQTQLPPPPRQSRPPTDEEIDADTAACGRICLEFEFEPGLALVLLHAYLFSLHHAMRSLMHPACNIMKIELGRHEIVSMCRG
ncbi:unnamed protein product, partial [Urochloa humidicola]